MATAKQNAAKAKQAEAAKGKGPSGKPVQVQSTALAKQNANTAVAVKSMADQLLADAGMGTEGIGKADLAIPRIGVLQALSPQCTKGNEAFVKGAEPGDFWDNVLQEVMAKAEEGFLFIPVSYRRAYLEWIPRTKNGGGFAGDHGSDESIMSQTTKSELGANILPNGNEIVPTGEYYAVILDLDGANPREAVISFSKTQLKKAARLNTAIKMLRVQVPGAAPGKTFNPAMFYSVFHATTTPESNDRGNWMGWDIKRHGNTLELPNGDDIYNHAKAFNQAVSSGSVKVAAPDAGGQGEVASQSDDDKL